MTEATTKKAPVKKTRAWQFIPSEDSAVDNIPPTVCTIQRAGGQIDGTTVPPLTVMRKVNAAQQYVIPDTSVDWDMECEMMKRTAKRYGMKELDLSKDSIGSVPERMRPKKVEDPQVVELRAKLAGKTEALDNESKTRIELEEEKDELKKAMVVMQEQIAKLEKATKK